MVKEKKMSYLDTIYQTADISQDSYVFQLCDLLVKRYLGEPLVTSNKKLLDIGCGKGHQTVAFARYFDTHAIDIANDSVELFNHLNLNVSFQCCDLENDKYPYPDDHFDVIFNKSVIEHVANGNHFVSEIRRLLKPSGKAIILTPSWETQYLNFFDDPTHVQPYTRRGLRNILEITGFQNPTIEHFIQLPFIWKFPILKIVPDLLSFLPESFKWKDKDQRIPNKLIRFSKERMLLAVVTK